MSQPLWKAVTGLAWFVYIVQTNRGHLYTGITTDVTRRVNEHNTDKRRSSKYCWSFRPVTLMWQKEYFSRSEASKVECSIKKLSNKEKYDVVTFGLTADPLGTAK